jgi:phospholipid-translocating ATPase
MSSALVPVAKPPPSTFQKIVHAPRNVIRSFNVSSLFQRKRSPPIARQVYINTPLPEDLRDKKGRFLKDRVFPTNQNVTSKYTIITFLPRNLLEQFRRVANGQFA